MTPADETKWALLCARIRSISLTFNLYREFECGAARMPALCRTGWRRLGHPPHE